MAYTDDLAIAQARLAALAPYLTQAQTSVLMNGLAAFLSSLSDTESAITASAQNITYTTASGAALRAKAADYNVVPSAGSPATIAVVFVMQAPAQQTISIPGPASGAPGTLVSTAGDGTTTPQINFTTTAGTSIPAGQTLAGAQIGPVTPPSGNSVSNGLVVATSTAQTPPTLTGALWTFTANGTATYTLTKTIPGGAAVPVTPPGGGSFATGTTYDDPTLIPGMKFTITGTLTSGHSATVTTGGTPVPAVCTAPGAIGNVAPGTVVVCNLGQGTGLQVSNALVVAGTNNPQGQGAGGVDPDTDAQIRNKIAVRATPLYGVANATAALLAVSGVYDAYVYDPLAGSGYVYYAWAQVDGTAPTITGGSTATGDGQTYITGATLSGLAATVDAQIRQYLPAGIVPRLYGAGGAASPFNVVYVSSVSITYTAPAAVQPSTIDPIIQQAAIAYYNSLLHNQAPTIFGLSQAVQTAVGYTLTNLTATGGSLGATPALVTLYRAAANMTVTVTP